MPFNKLNPPELEPLEEELELLLEDELELLLEDELEPPPDEVELLEEELEVELLLEELEVLPVGV